MWHTSHCLDCNKSWSVSSLLPQQLPSVDNSKLSLWWCWIGSWVYWRYTEGVTRYTNATSWTLYTYPVQHFQRVGGGYWEQLAAEEVVPWIHPWLETLMTVSRLLWKYHIWEMDYSAKVLLRKQYSTIPRATVRRYIKTLGGLYNNGPTIIWYQVVCNCQWRSKANNCHNALAYTNGTYRNAIIATDTPEHTLNIYTSVIPMLYIIYIDHVRQYHSFSWLLTLESSVERWS